MKGLLGFVKDIFHGLRPSSAMSQQHQHEQGQEEQQEQEAPSSPPRSRMATRARRRQEEEEEAASQRGKRGRRTPPQQDAEAIGGCIPRQQQLTRQVLSLLGPGADQRYGEELMRLILTKGRATLDVQLAFPDETDSEGEEEEEEEDGGRGKRIHADLELGYQGEAYACMDDDKWRNVYFRRAIAIASGAALPPFPPAFPIATAAAQAAALQQEQEDGKWRGGSSTTIDSSSNSSSNSSSSGSDSSSSDDRPQRRRGGGRAEAAPSTLLANSPSPSPGPTAAGGTEETWTGRKRSWRAALLLSSPCAAPASSSSLSSSPLFPTAAAAAAAAAKEEKGARRWLEIGPGAMGTLSRMVLDADRHNTLLAIEAVPHSARALEAGLRAAYPLMPVPGGEERETGKKWASASPTRPRPPKRGRASKGVAARALASPVVSGAGTLSSSFSSSAPLLPRFRVVQGLAGHVRLPPCGVGGQHHEALVAEVLGHLASSEGYVAILHQMGRAHPSLARRLRVAIPRFFGTKWAPVDLSAAGEDDRALRIAALEERLALFEAFPLHACRLPLVDGDDDGVMERYDALEELRLGAADRRRRTSSTGSGKGRGSSPSPLGPRVFTPSTWTVAAAAAAECKGEEGGEGERPFHGLACYIAFGEDPAPHLAAPFPRLASSRAADPYRCTNWCNVFLPVGGGAWRVRPGDRIVARARCHVHLAEPHYDVHVAVHRPSSHDSGGDNSGVGDHGGGGGGGGRLSGAGKQEAWASEGPAAGCVVVYEEELCVRYRDLVGRVDTVRAFLRRRERGEWR